MDRLELERRVALTIIQLTHTSTAGLTMSSTTAAHLDQARSDLIEVNRPNVIRRAWQQLSDHAPGLPTDSMPGPSGKGGHSDRVAALAVDAASGDGDKVTRDSAELDERTDRLVTQTRTIYQAPPRTYAAGIQQDARCVRSILKAWSIEPQVRWCTNCRRDADYREPVAGGRYRDVCRRCGDWRRVNGSLPSVEILRYLHSGQRIPHKVLARYRSKLPRSMR